MTRSTLICALAVAASATLAPPAVASEYTIDFCRHADGSPAPLDGFQPVVSDDYPAGNIAANSCAQGGHVDLALGAGSHTKAGGPASVLLVGAPLPPGASWTRLQAWMAYQASPTTPAQDPAHRVAMTVAGTTPCAWGIGGAGCSQFGSFDASPLADVNRITVTPTQPGQPLALGVMCDSTPSACPATSGDPYARARVWRISVTINDPTPPPTTPATHDPGQPAPVEPGATAKAGKLTIRMRVRSSRTVRISGRLTNSKGRPVGRARLILRRQVPGGPPAYSRVVTRRDGTFARTLGRGRRTARVSVRWVGRNVQSRTVKVPRRK